MVCSGAADEFGDHYVSCSHSNQRIGKHNALTNCVAEKLRSAKVSLAMELSVDKDRMGDLVLRHWSNGRDLYLDFSVVSSLCGSYRSQAAKSPGGATSARVSEKMTKYSKQAQKVWFQPFVVETLGGWDVSAISLLKQFAARMAEHQFIDAKTSLQRLMTSLSICLQRYNGDMLATRYYQYN